MKRIQYLKTDTGIIIVSVDEVESNQPQNVFERYENFFQNVPLHGGREWQLRSPEEIAAFFREAIAVFIFQYEQLRNEAEYKHKRSWWWTKMWRKLRKWQLPEVPTEKELLKRCAERCESLADWMEKNQSRPFYAGSDMSDYIVKPRRVAAMLR